MQRGESEKAISYLKTAVREVMATELFTIAPATAGECMVHMTDHHIGHLPVLEAGRVVGVILIGDVARALIEDMRFTAARELHPERGVKSRTLRHQR